MHFLACLYWSAIPFKSHLRNLKICTWLISDSASWPWIAKKKFYRFSVNSVTLLLKSIMRNKIKSIFWISAGIRCQKIHRRGSGGWKEMWSRCFAHSMQCLTPLSMQWLSCSLILEAEKSHLIVSSSTCFGALFNLFSEKLGHSNNMICGFICFSFTFWNLSFLQVIAVLLCGSSQGRPSLLGAAGEDHHHHHEEHHHHEPHQVQINHSYSILMKDVERNTNPGSGLLLLWLRLPAGGRKESWGWGWVLWGHHPCQGLQLPIWGFQQTKNIQLFCATSSDTDAPPHRVRNRADRRLRTKMVW